MKIRKRILLFTIEIFIHFMELSASPKPSEEDSYLKVPNTSKRQKLKSQILRYPYLNAIIKMIVKVDEEGAYRATSCHVLTDEKLVVPTLVYRKTHNFITKALIRLPYEGYLGPPLKCVIFINEDKKGVHTVIGTRLPPFPAKRASFVKGDPKLLNPNDSKWYITYDGVDYVVTQNSTSTKPEDIHRLYGDLRPELEYIYEFSVKIDHIVYGGVHFIRYRRGTDNVVVGAQLPSMKNAPRGYTDT